MKRNKKIETAIAVTVFIMVAVYAFIEYSGNKNPVVTLPVTEDKEYGGVYLEISIEDFDSLGFVYGDSVDVSFSNGYELTDIPYYDGYYEKVNNPVLVSYPGYDYVCASLCSGDSLWTVSGCKEGDTATVTLKESGKYISQQEAMASTYTPDRADYDSDEIFANFRTFSCGDMKENTFYRGASPVNNQNNRASTVDSLIREAGIRFILDLSDNETKVQAYDAQDSYFMELYNSGKVSLLGLSASYRSDSYAASLAGGFRQMMNCAGPYYVHCVEGKDRTGFVCILMEALCGGSYEEIEADYMETYFNYYKITEETDSAKYNALKELRLDDMLFYLYELDGSTIPSGGDLSGLDFSAGARKYLLNGGMTEAEVDAFTDFLTK